jgi:hypothetical protein
LTKRRSQIAAASRKSRAKRKQELTTLRDANEVLEKENEWLRMRLSALGEPTSSLNARPNAPTTVVRASQGRKRSRDVCDTPTSDDTSTLTPKRVDTDGCSTVGSLSGQVTPSADQGDNDSNCDSTSPAASHQSHRVSDLKSLKQRLLEISDNALVQNDEHVVMEENEDEAESSNKGLGVFKSFLKSRLSRFFGELKQDTLTHFGEGLQTHTKEQLANLQLLVRNRSIE